MEVETEVVEEKEEEKEEEVLGNLHCRGLTLGGTGEFDVGG